MTIQKYIASLKITDIVFYGLFFCALILNEVSLFFPENLNNRVTSFLLVPILVIRYFGSTTKPNYVYMLSFLFTYIAITVYVSGIKYSFAIGLLLYSIGILIYAFLAKKNTYFNLVNLKQYLFVALAILIVPIYLTVNKVSLITFTSMLIYTLSIIFFLYCSFLLVKQNRPHAKYALIASIIYTFSTFCTALLIFYSNNLIITITATTTFWFAHLFMNLYMTNSNIEKAA